MILVTGATGNVGIEVGRALLEREEHVRALVRDPASAQLPAGVEPFAGDLNEPETFQNAFDAVTSIFMLAGYAKLDETLERAARADVRRVVLLSSGAVEGGEPGNAVVRLNAEAEAAVRASALSWTILRPSGYMSNALRWLPQLRDGDEIIGPFGGVPVACIDPADIGAVAALALIDDRHAGQTYRLTGPTPMVPAEQVAALAAVLGRPLRFHAQPDDVAYAEMLTQMPREYADAFRNFFVDGAYNDAHVLSTVQHLTSRAPRSFEEWARAHVDRFRSDDSTPVS